MFCNRYNRLERKPVMAKVSPAQFVRQVRQEISVFPGVAVTPVWQRSRFSYGEYCCCIFLACGYGAIERGTICSWVWWLRCSEIGEFEVGLHGETMVCSPRLFRF